MCSSPDSNQIPLGTAPMVDRWSPPRGAPKPPSYQALCHKVVFHGVEHGAADYYEVPTPGGCGRRVTIRANQPLAAKINAISKTLDPTDSYEDDPDAYERRVCMHFADAAPELMAAMACARASDAIIVEVHGLPLSGQIPDTPLDGVVNEHSVRAQVSNLVGAVAGGWRLSGFAYSSENDSKLLRAVCPLKQYASTASSHGYGRDLVWHQDNANRSVPWVPDHHPTKRGPMNPFQAFVAIRPSSPPMELVALSDVIDQAVRRFGPGLVEQLTRNDFAVNKPDSHGSGRDVEGVPLLMCDDHGVWHSRFHALNVIGLTAVAQRALRQFTEVVVGTCNIIEAEARPGSLLLYSNTRSMHNRRKYAAALDGNDRYYVRLYLMPSEMLSRHEAYMVKRRIFS
jgi:hypothetical protein